METCSALETRKLTLHNLLHSRGRREGKGKCSIRSRTGPRGEEHGETQKWGSREGKSEERKAKLCETRLGKAMLSKTKKAFFMGTRR